jgi:hypothetical protein
MSAERMEGAISFIGKKGNCASLNKKQAGRHSNVKKKSLLLAAGGWLALAKSAIFK